jgi:hypothetical protein
LAAKRRRELLRFAHEWVDCQLRWKHYGIALSNREKTRIAGVSEELVAKVVMYQLLMNEGALDTYFRIGWARVEFPYHADSLEKDRDWAYPVWERWTDVATQQLSEWQPGEHPKETRRLLKSLIAVLPTRTAKDSWDVTATAAQIENRLRDGFGQSDAKMDLTRHDLLAALIQCDAPFPDSVINNGPTDDPTSEQLAAFSHLIDSGITYEEYRRKADKAKGLIQAAPFHCVKAIVTSQDRPTSANGRKVSQLEMIRPASDVKDVTYWTGRSSKKVTIDPLLLLAIVAELSGEHSSAIDYSQLRRSSDYRRHIQDTLRCTNVIGSIAEKWVKKMHATANETAREEIEKLAPGIGN